MSLPPDFRLALHGPMYAGKTELAGRLHHEGARLIDYTGYLKVLTARALTAAGKPTTPQCISTNKGYYRPLLQHMGTYLGFNEGEPIPALLGEFTEHADDGELADDGLWRRMVFDNVRTPEQMAVLRHYGFRLVFLNLGAFEQERRAADLGVTLDELRTFRRHDIERPLPSSVMAYCDIILDADQPQDVVYADLMHRLDLSRLAA